MKQAVTTFGLILAFSASSLAFTPSRPNIILLMTDDQGWGQTSYNHHPFLKTPNLDKMAASGLRFDRFYAGAPVCSPTRASVLTGRVNERTGVVTHGYALRLQEKTIAQAIKAAEYATAHFGKWHLDGFRGDGVPILEGDTHSPGAFGFDVWLSSTNYFDMDPLLSRNGKIVEFTGDSSGIIVNAALYFIKETQKKGQPFSQSSGTVPHTAPMSPVKPTVLPLPISMSGCSTCMVSWWLSIAASAYSAKVCVI